ncbi:adenylate/guanylate cyclase domain-containing protein [Mycobacterium shinjukuense]|nr:adenylate/guanylate cyclase domain-containing protein [Mycobacterium shinjukuense]ORB70122.1 adenylate/guanylate cyclase domain-containing protein [Mycobacterium shinjukuense]
MSEPLGYLVTHIDDRELVVPIFDQLYVGRECVGISEQRRLLIADPAVSRNHLEIRLDAAADQAFAIDTSTNGTWLNGVRLVRDVPAPIQAHDRIRIGKVELTFQTDRFTAVGELDPNLTYSEINEAAMVMVVGDITGYSTISQVTDHKLIAQGLHTLWQQLGHVLRDYRGTLIEYAGDALYAVWELNTLPRANELAIDFALAANRRVDEIGHELPLRHTDGSSIHMGWGVVQGKAALTAMAHAETVLGDSTNLAFRLAGIAGRGGRAPVMVTDVVHAAVEAQYVWGPAERVEIKGRHGMQTVYAVLRRR